MTTKVFTRREAAAAIMRGIGARRRRPAGAVPHFACTPCAVAWRGPEADCWSCGRPATTEYTHRRAALQLLLHGTGTELGAIS